MKLHTKVINTAVLGVLSHMMIFIRGEYHTKIFKILGVYLFAALLVFYHERDENPTSWVRNTLSMLASYFVGLFGSITIYRVYFHPLKQFPGPPLAKVSKIWHVVNVLQRQNHIFLDGIQKKYGNIVRTGPSELTIFEAEVFQAISGPGTTCIKSDFYDLIYPLVAINSIREKEGYAPRRKMWDRSFKISAVRKDISTILKYANTLVEDIEEADAQTLVVNIVFSRFAYAVMSDLAFARTFHTLEHKQIDDNVSLIQSGINVLGFVLPAPWLAQLLFGFPGLASSWNRMLEWASTNIRERLETDYSQDNFSSWLIEALQGNDGRVDTNGLYGDALAVTVAGSHSTSATLVFLFYELASNPIVQRKLRKELSSGSPSLDIDILNESRYLNACIDETLRLYPILPTAGVRQTRTNGITVAGRYIPPYTNIVAPRYSIGRLESCFEQAAEFIPERWTERAEMVKEHRAHNPFNIGRHNCPGRWLGLLEIRIVTALLLSRFDVRLGPGKRNKTRVVENMTDNFTIHPGQLELQFHKL